MTAPDKICEPIYGRIKTKQPKKNDRITNQLQDLSQARQL